MFNIVYGSPKSLKISDTINEIKQIFVGCPFAWWISSSDYNPKITEAILEAGLEMEITEHAMICDLNETSISLEKKTDLNIKRVEDQSLLQDFLKVLEFYDNHVQEFYKQMNDELFEVDEKLFVGYMDNIPVTIGILLHCQNSAGIFSLITNEGMRGKGYGTEMMLFLMNLAKKSGCRLITLSASSDAGYRIYKRLGFSGIGAFECFEYKGENA